MSEHKKHRTAHNHNHNHNKEEIGNVNFSKAFQFINNLDFDKFSSVVSNMNADIQNNPEGNQDKEKVEILNAIKILISSDKIKLLNVIVQVYIAIQNSKNNKANKYSKEK